MFQSLLLDGVLATVQSFDGSANVLSLTLPVERGGAHLTAMILDALQATVKARSDSAVNTIGSDCPQPKIPEGWSQFLFFIFYLYNQLINHHQQEPGWFMRYSK